MKRSIYRKLAFAFIFTVAMYYIMKSFLRSKVKNEITGGENS